MALVYLGVNQSFSASLITSQGTLDDISGSTDGNALACPGVFPINIRTRFRVRGSGTLVNDSVLAASNSVVLRGIVHDDVPYAGNRVRLETRQPTYKIAGGRYVSTYSTVNPLGPYLPIPNNFGPSISLTGLPSQLYLSTSPTTNTSIPVPLDPSNPSNVHQSTSSFTSSFTGQNMADGVNMMWSSSAMSINLSGEATNLYFRNTTTTTDLRGAVPVQIKKYPFYSVSDNNIIDEDILPSSSTRTDAQYHTAATLMAQSQLTISLFLCFSQNPNASNGYNLENSVFGTVSSPSAYIKKLAFYKSETNAGAYTFAAIQESGISSYAAIGMFSASLSQTPRARFFDVHYFKGNAFSSQNASIEGAGIKPAFGVNSQFISSKSNLQSTTRLFWSNMFPIGERKNEYSDVVSTQYGFVFLNKNTKHLEYMFRPHYDPGHISSAAQVINKLIHPPPRSADYIPAANMALGADLADTSNGYSASSIYKNAATTTAFNSDHILHGGGGHVMALGTYNGAIVSGGKIAVWGSNRWGQCVVPSQVAGLSSAIIDVAVSNAPPALAGYSHLIDSGAGDESFYIHSVYSDELAEFLARDLRSYTQDTANGSEGDIYNFYDTLFYNLNSYYMSYHYPTIHNPNDNSIRYGGHINFTNLPGHVLLVTDTGWVYAWGNNKYNQCSVPAEINLLDASGNVRTAANSDPIMEVSAGAFHSLARSKSGYLYAWGAGNHSITSTQNGITYPGYLVGTDATDTPFLNNGQPNVRQSVHFAQCVIQYSGSNGSSYFGFANPSTNPPGTTSTSSDNYVTFSVFPIANVTTVSNHSGTVVGQKAQICANEQNTSGIRCKGYIAAGAFHTAIVDNKFKIQCIGAGRGPTNDTFNIGTIFPAYNENILTYPDNSTLPHWGSSYSSGGHPNSNQSHHDSTIFGSYPHYCQSMSQYRAPWPAEINNEGTINSTPDLFRFSSDATLSSKCKYFQDLRFKKVVCGPFSTHGIVYDVFRGTSGLYSLNDRIEMHGRVVSWGSVYGTRSAIRSATGPTGICQYITDDIVSYSWKKYSLHPAYGSSVNGNIKYNPAGVVSGTGSISFLRGIYNPSINDFNPDTTNYVSRSFELLNRSNSVTGFTYQNSASLLNNIGYTFVTGAPVTISKFKVKDMASCGDYSIYAGYINTLTQSSTKLYSGQASNSTSQTYNNSGASFDYQSSVFFTGPDYYYSGTSDDDDVITSGSNHNSFLVTYLYGRMYANNPFSSAGRLTRRNRVGTPWLYNNSTGIKLNTKSLYFGEIRQSSGIANPSIGTTSVSINYVNATTVLASNNMVCAVVGMDNRPVAWSCYFQPRRAFDSAAGLVSYYSSPIDLTLIPSVPFKEIKAGKSHILAISDGDWPIAKSLSNLVPSGSQQLKAQTPKLVTELGTRLFTSSSLPEVPVKLISAAAGTIDHQFGRPVLLAFGAGDGREYGTSLLGYPFGYTGVSTYGSWFLDTHAITRYDSNAVSPSQSLSVNVDDWENYYGHYRWNLHSADNSTYSNPPVQSALSTSTTPINNPLIEGAGFSNPSSSETTLTPGHHLCESMQSMLQFQPEYYPTTFTNPDVGARALLNGTMMAGIPVGAYRPWISFSSLKSGQDLNRVVCCATAAEEAESNYASLNTQLEYHSPLNFARQSYTDYVVDYAAGSLHSAILFSSACKDYNEIQNNTHLNNLSNFRQHFMSGSIGEIHFGQRRICKLGIVGYGCENQTAGRERKLSDGMAPIVPMLFSRSAKVYCGESYTLVTDPVRVVYAQSSPTSLTFIQGTTVSTCTVPINIPPSLFSKRLRGFDITLKFTHSDTGDDIPLSDLTFKLPYKRSTFILLNRVRAQDNFAYLKVNGGTFVSLKISDRFHSSKAYSYSENSQDLYSEAGLSPANLNSYTQTSSRFYIKGLDLSPTIIPALSNQGCYYPVSVDPETSSVTVESWNLASTTVPKFDEQSVNIVIEDVTNTNHSYTGYQVTATIEAEVDASDVPYVIFGPTRSGAWNEIPGLGPSYVADIGSFSTAYASTANIETLSCPCEAQTSTVPILNRKHPKSFISDSSFVCGTKKYGPLGNRENQAAYVTETYLTRAPLLKYPRITANFFSIFTVVPHRPAELLNEQVYDLGVTMHSLPSDAFLITGQSINLSSTPIALKFTADNFINTHAFLISLHTSTVTTQAVFSINSPILYNKAFFPPNINMSLRTNSALGLIIVMRSDYTDCGTTAP
jgi:hypothetical protein